MSKLSAKLTDALNKQINREYYSSYLYLAMSAYCEENALPGSAHWLKLQAQEELGHALKLYDYILDRDGKVVLEGIEKPPSEFGTALALFEKVMAHEQSITAALNDIYGLAVKDNDYASQAFLQWYVTEQVEEEKTVKQILDQLKAVGDKSSSIFYIDRHLGKRA